MKLRQKPNGMWLVDFEDEDGNRRRVSTKIKTAPSRAASSPAMPVVPRPLNGALCNALPAKRNRLPPPPGAIAARGPFACDPTRRRQ